MPSVELNTATVSAKAAGAVVALAVTAGYAERFAAVEKAATTGRPIAISFAKFNDGRGFSLARLLRSEHGYRGVIIASGHTIPDQALHLLRTGFDSVEVGDPARLPDWLQSLASYSGSYQNAARNPLSLRREAASRRSLNSEPVPGSVDPHGKSGSPDHTRSKKITRSREPIATLEV